MHLQPFLKERKEKVALAVPSSLYLFKKLGSFAQPHSLINFFLMLYVHVDSRHTCKQKFVLGLVVRIRNVSNLVQIERTSSVYKCPKRVFVLLCLQCRT